MKKILYLFLFVGLAATGCNKMSESPSTQDILTQDIVFKATPCFTSGLSETNCINPMAHYAILDIDDTIHSLEVFYINNVIYTKAFKLAPGTHSLKRFTLYNNGGTQGLSSELMADDFIVQATPLKNSDFEPFVEMALPYEFEVNASLKLEIDILCFNPKDAMLFGYENQSVVPGDEEVNFRAETTIIREVCFYGNFCTKYYLDYGESVYARQVNGLQHDMPAIFKIEVWRTQQGETDSIATYHNEDFLGEGLPLCVKYPDLIGAADLIEFKLFILVKVGEGFEYLYFHTFSTWDAMPLENIGNDNVMDFALGSCVENADLVLPPYLNLPHTADVQTAVDNDGFWPGTQGTFLDITLSGIGNGFDIQNGLVGGWVAGDMNSEYYIYDYAYTADVYSSLYPNKLPAEYSSTAGVLDNINWLANNLHHFPGNTYYEFQFAVWGMIHPPDATGNPMVIDMIREALAKGDGYMPPVGGNAAVILDDPGDGYFGFLQYLIFIVIDP